MAQYKLTYFDMKGRAEPARFLFKVANVPFEDVRVSYANFPEMKPTLPYGQLPILQIGDEVLSQSMSIGRYLSRKFGYHGKTEFEAAKVDEVVDALHEYEHGYWEWFGDEKSKPQVIEKFLGEATPKYMSKCSEILEKNGGEFLVGKSLTFADIYLFNLIDYYSQMTKEDMIKGFPVLQAFCKGIGSIPEIKEWVEKRPQSDM